MDKKMLPIFVSLYMQTNAIIYIAAVWGLQIDKSQA
jgi:hypothetical protein